MTEREKQLEKNIVEYSIKTIEEQKKQIGIILERQQKMIVRDVLWTFHELFQKAINSFNDNEGKEVAYIVISFLNTGILNNSIELKIDLYDNNIHFDKKPITGYYEFHFLDDIISKDISDFQNYIERKMIRVRYQELYRYRRVCMIKYKSIMEECMQTYVDLIIKLKSFLSMNKTPEFKIVYGELMCKNTILYENVED